MSPVDRFIDAGLCGSGRANHAGFARLVLGWDWLTAMYVGVIWEGWDLTPERARAMAASHAALGPVTDSVGDANDG